MTEIRGWSSTTWVNARILLRTNGNKIASRSLRAVASRNTILASARRSTEPSSAITDLPKRSAIAWTASPPGASSSWTTSSASRRRMPSSRRNLASVDFPQAIPPVRAIFIPQPYLSAGAGVALASLSAAVVSESWFWMIWRQFGSTRRAETKIRRLRLLDHSLRLRKRRPTKGMSPRKGILSSIDLRSSVMRPPITMVEPL